jgi:pimeloyl-ACP methyl ester carboxylesterase
MCSSRLPMRRALPSALAGALAAALAACAGAPPAPTAPAQARLVPTTRGRIWVDDGGHGGLPVLFLGGMGADAGAWGAQLDHARRSRRAVALELPGFGRSDPPRGGDYGAGALGEDVGRAADALGLSRFVLVAHDFAAAPAAAYAARHPLRVAAILFVDGFGGTVDRSPAAAEGVRRDHEPAALARPEERYALLLKGARGPTRERVLAALGGTRAEALRGVALALLDNDPVAELRAWTGPRLALCASQLVMVGLPATVEGIPYEKVEQTSHWIMLDRPEAVNAALDRLIANAK